MEHGKVTTVEYRDGVVYCNVRPVRAGVEYEAVPVLKPHSGFIQIPSQGDTVTMERLDKGTLFITNVLEKSDANPDNVREGELAIQLDKGTRIYFEKTDSGDYDLHLDASGDVYINGVAQ